MKSVVFTCLALSLLLLPLQPVKAQGISDLVIATNAEVTFPSCTEELTHFYFFTVVDDDPNAGTMSTPSVSNLGYVFTGPNQIDVYDVGEFNYATYELAVTIPSPDLGQQTSDCFTITYEGESVNPCFDVKKPDAEVCGDENEVVAACVNMENGMVRIVLDDVRCRDSEYRTALLLPPAPVPAAAAAAAASPRRE